MKQGLMVFWLALFSPLLLAEAFIPLQPLQVYGGIGHGSSVVDISTLDEDKVDDSDAGSLYAKLFVGWHLTDYLALETGVLAFTDYQVDDKDAVGTYSLELDRHDVYLGPVLQFKPRHFLPLRFMLAATWSQVTLELRESFYGVSPAGKARTRDDVFGVMLSAGFLLMQRTHVSAMLSLDYVYRPDLFDDSDRSFDMRDTGLSFRLFFH